MLRMGKREVGSWSIALLGLVLAGAAAPPLPLSQSATQALLARLTMNGQAGGMGQLQLLGVETWTDSGRPADDNTETDRVFFHHTVSIEETLSRDGKVLPPKQAAREARQAAQIVARVDRAWTGPADNGRLFNLDGEIWTVARFTKEFDWSGEEGPAVNGAPSVILHFSPRTGLHPGSRIERILSRTEGAFVVDPTTGQIRSGSFASLGPIRFGAGILADIEGFSGRFSLAPATGGWVLQQVHIVVRGRALFHSLTGSEDMRYTVAPTLDAAQP